MSHTVKMTIFRITCVIILIAGLKVGCDSTATKAPVATSYQQQMLDLESAIAAAEKTSQDAVQASQGNPNEVMKAMENLHATKEQILRKMEALSPTEEFKESHVVMLEWRNRQQDNESQMLAGFRDYAKTQSKETEKKMEALSQENSDIGAKYEANALQIAKKHGFESVGAYFRGSKKE